VSFEGIHTVLYLAEHFDEIAADRQQTFWHARCFFSQTSPPGNAVDWNLKPATGRPVRGSGVASLILTSAMPVCGINPTTGRM